MTESSPGQHNPFKSQASGAVFFDVDGTLARTTIVHYYAYFRKRRLSPIFGTLWHAVFLLKCAGYLVLDKLDRGRLNVVFYRNYRGLSVEAIKNLASECYEQVLMPRLYVEAVDCVAKYQSEGLSVVLVTGSLNFLTEPLAKHLEVSGVIAGRLVEAGGVFTGELSGPPLSDGEKARQIGEYACAKSIDLAQSHAYGDSISDLPMLEAVGFPHAVNPDRALRRSALKRGWPIHHWTLKKREVTPSSTS